MRPVTRRLSTEGLPAQPFFHTPEQRVGLARQRFFEEDVRPSGLVSEAVIQSWGRSRSLGHASHKPPALDPVSRGSLHTALARNRDLLDAARTDLGQLEASLTGTQCRVLLVDATGVIVHATQGACVPGQHTLNLASRVGVNLSESHIGTTAPGIVVHTGLASAVLGSEHFYDRFQLVRCAAAPIRDAQGRLAGVLDLSTESRGFGFDAATLVGLFATSIENRLLQAQSDRHLVLHFQATPSLLGTPLEGLVGVSTGGEVVWLNATAHSLLGCSPTQATGSLEALFGVGLHALLAQCAASGAHLMKLPSGLGIWLRAELRQRDGLVCGHPVAWAPPRAPGANALPAADTSVRVTGVLPAASVAGACGPAGRADAAARDAAARTDGATGRKEAGGESLRGAAAPASGADMPNDRPAGLPADRPGPPAGAHSLAEAQRELVLRTLQAQNGNVAKTARLLGVSRGLVYRHRNRAGTG